MRTKILACLAALITTLTMTAVATPTAAHAKSCTPSSSSSGNAHDGTWTKHYCTDNGATEATASVTYSSYTDGNNHNHTRYDFSVTTGPIIGNDCVYIALDWDAPGSDHGDAQIMRNCYENSTRGMSVLDIDDDEHCATTAYCSPREWTVRRLQIGVFNPDGTTKEARIDGRVCPTDLAVDSDTTDECLSWWPDGAFSSVGAKIWIRYNSGDTDQNDPKTPAYEVNNVISPNR